MASHLDPNHRRQSFHRAPSLGSSGQERRRKQALEAQKQRRTHAIEAARSSFRDLDIMEDLSVAESDSEGEAVPERFQDAEDKATPVIAKAKRKSHKPKFRAWAKNLLCQAETLDLRHSLPEALERDWRLSVCPKGKRCLLATTTEGAEGNTILYSRVAGRTLARLRTVLPPDCLFDAVWDSSNSVLWILDLMKWKGQYMVNCEAEMRAFFVASKLSELPTQPYLPPDPSASATRPSSRPTLVLPVPSLPPPLTPSAILPLLNSLSAPSTMPCIVFAPMLSPDSSQPAFRAQTMQIPFISEGLLLYVSSAHYESGSTPLVGWVPCEVKEPEARDAEGTERLKKLVEEWQGRGGEAAIALRGEEVQMDGA
ncbi:hypothetical protein JCM10213_000120 [Rhodosporidiobolus nylandii]